MTYTRFLLGSTCCAMLAGLSACAWLIPEDQSVPRYNSVNGPLHHPERNTIVPTADTTPDPDRQSMTTPAPVAPVAANDIAAPAPAPVMAPKAIPAEQPTAIAPLPVPPVAPEVKAKADAQIAKDSVQTAMSPRQVPVENREFTVASNTIAPAPAPAPAPIPTQPALAPLPVAPAPAVAPAPVANGNGLMNVPPHPVTTGPDSVTANLNQARRDLEQSRTDATAAKADLARDVAAEPTAFPEKLAPLPQAAPAPVATPAPVAAAPVAPASLPPAVAITIPPQVRNEAPVPPAPLPPAEIAAADLTPPPPPPVMQVPPKPVAAAAAPVAQPLSAPATTKTTPTPVLTSTPIGVVPASAPITTANNTSFNPMAAMPTVTPTIRPIQLTPPGAAPADARAGTSAAVNALPPTSSDFNPLADNQVAANTTPGTVYLPPSRYHR